MRQFETPGSVHLQVKNTSGEVRIAVHEATTTEVEIRALTPASEEQAALTRVECTEEAGEHRVVVDVPSPRHEFWSGNDGVEVLIRVPEGARLDVATASSDVGAEGRYAGGSIRTASGDVRWEQATGDMTVATASGDVTVHYAEAGLEVRSANGDIWVDRASGQLKLGSESGDVHVGRAEGMTRLRGASSDVQVGMATGTLEVHTASGDVTVREAHADCGLESNSGDVEVGLAYAGKIRVETMSGDVTVGIAPGARVAVDTQTRTGDLHSDIPLSPNPDPDGNAGSSPLVTLQLRTVSGDVHITRGR